MAVNQLEVLKHSLITQNKQGEALVAVINRVEQIEVNVNKRYEEITDVVEEVKNRIHLEEADATRIKSIVASKANRIAKVKYPDTKEFGAEYRELVGYARREVYKRLRKHFNVTKYTSIRHVDREEAVEFVESINLDTAFLKEYEQWRYQKIKKAERELEMMEKENA